MELLPRVYAELKRIASARLRNERAGHTLQATALVHEAYLRLAGHEVRWHDRSHFFALAAQAMRQILVDYARRRGADKRGGGDRRVDLEEGLLLVDGEFAMMHELDLALHRLAGFAPRQAQVVEMRFFGGMTEDEIAGQLHVSSRTVKRDWLTAKAWLHGELAS